MGLIIDNKPGDIFSGSVSYSKYVEPHPMKKIVIPDNALIIEPNGFENLEFLESIIISDDVYLICKHAFDGCKSLSEVKLPKKLKHIQRYAFCDCISLKSIVIPENTISISECAFHGCYNLYEITIESEDIEINWYAFEMCPSLTVIHAPDSVMVNYFDMFMAHSYKYANAELRARLMAFKCDNRDLFPKEQTLNEWLENNE